MALDRLPASEQAEWLAFDFARRGKLPRPPVDESEAPDPSKMSPMERLKYVMDRQP